MSEGTIIASNGRKQLTADQLADHTRFRFREEDLYIPEIDGVITLKSLTVEERESLPDPEALLEINDRGERTRAALKDAALVFSIVCVNPKVTAEQAETFLGAWPAEAFDRITTAYAKLVGNREEAQAAAAEFPG